MHVWLVIQLCPTLGPHGDCSLDGFFSMGLFRQEYQSGLPCPPLGYLPDPGIKPRSPALAGRFFTSESPGKPYTNLYMYIYVYIYIYKTCVFISLTRNYYHIAYSSPFPFLMCKKHCSSEILGFHICHPLT